MKLRSRPENNVPLPVDEGHVLVREADGADRRVVHTLRGISVALHPVDRPLRIKSSIEQVENPNLIDRWVEESDAIERHDELDVPEAAHRRVSNAARRLN